MLWIFSEMLKNLVDNRKRSLSMCINGIKYGREANISITVLVVLNKLTLEKLGKVINIFYAIVVCL